MKNIPDKNFTYEKIKSLVSDDFYEMNNFAKKAVSFDFIGNSLFRDDIRTYLESGSKQIRSCLVFLFARMLSGNVDERVIKLAAAVEIIHNATLIHDDIIDEAEIRRGKEALHKKYGSRLSVISGDYLLSAAIKILTSVNESSVVEIFAKYLQNLCYGEIKQYFSQRKTVSVEEYKEKSKAKTASLFSAALLSLAEITKMDRKDDLEQFSEHFGIAFQIKNDLDSIINNSLADIKNGVYTAPVIFAFGENKDLSDVSDEKICFEAQKEKNILKTKKLIESEAELAKQTLSEFTQNVYGKAILSICEILCK